MIEHLEDLNLNEDLDCNDFGLAFDAYRVTGSRNKKWGAECSPCGANRKNPLSNL